MRLRLCSDIWMFCYSYSVEMSVLEMQTHQNLLMEFCFVQNLCFFCPKVS